MLDFTKPLQPWVSSESPLAATTTITSPITPKRRKQSNVAIASQQPASLPALKRTRSDDDDADALRARKKVALSSVEERDGRTSQPVLVKPDMGRARDAIEQQFQLSSHALLRITDQFLEDFRLGLGEYNHPMPMMYVSCALHRAAQLIPFSAPALLM